MALPLADRVKDSSNTTGSGASLTLLNVAPLGYVTFLQGFGSSSAKPVCYVIEDPLTGAWESGFGTYTSATNLINRAIVTANSSQTTSRITLTAGTKDVFCSPISKSIVGQNSAGDIEIPNISQGGSVNITPQLSSAGYAATGFNISCPVPTVAAQNGTYIDIAAGESSTTGDGGYLGLSAGSTTGAGLGGSVFVYAGGGDGGGGIVEIIAGDGNAGGGGIDITAGGVSASGAGAGGNITITSGLASGSGSNGSIEISLAGIVAIAIQPANATSTAPVKIGFFGATPIVKPTGVAVTAADIHTALVNLGLIAA
jgi:hypothetical protein